jgi:hypothetical protein
MPDSGTLKITGSLKFAKAYPLLIKQGLLENPNFIDECPIKTFPRCSIHVLECVYLHKNPKNPPVL